jgi:hypothetical protein
MVLNQAQVRNIFHDDNLKLSNRQMADRFVDLFLAGIRSPRDDAPDSEPTK